MRTIFRNTTLDNLADVLLIILVICLPFEFRTTPPHLTELQVLFLLLMAASTPRIIRNHRKLISNPVVVAALLFLATVWISAAASAQTMNAIKAAIRYTAGVGLLCAVLQSEDTKRLREAWAIAAMAAALYGLLDYFGFGFPTLFREMEFYFGDVRRLSGSFEYPNAAAAYYALSLPVVWTELRAGKSRFVWSAVVWAALLLTFSRGALIGVVGIVLIWAIRTRSFRPIALVLPGLLVFAPISIFRPALFVRLAKSPQSTIDHNAEYRLKYNLIKEKPGVTSEMPIVIRNTGRQTWPHQGQGQITISYHWYNTSERRIVETTPIETPLPHDVAPNETIDVTAQFRTPDSAGVYLLDWDLKYLSYHWFSITDGVPPSVVQAEIAQNAESWRGNGDVSSWYDPPDEKAPPPASDIPRGQLWHAAWILFSRHPILGIGPDNYRLSYGKVLGFARTDTDVHSNSLYLEILVGSGAVGLLAFVFLLLRVPWRRAAAIPPLGVALIHGLVDFFLMTTPIYFAFWILVGEASQAAKEGD